MSLKVVSFGGPPQAGGLPVLIFMCGSAQAPGCHKILSISAMPPMIAPEPQPIQEREPLIMTPGMAFNGR